MSKYTTELGYIVRNFAPEFPLKEQIEQSIPNIFDFDFPLWDESYKSVLCTKIIRHYFFSEIGQETYGRWKFMLETRLNEIMPYYNELYNTAVLKYDPLIDLSRDTTHELKHRGTDDTSIRNDGSTITTAKDTDTFKDTRETTTSSTFNNQGSSQLDSSVTHTFSDTTTHKGTTSTEDKGTQLNTKSDTPQGTLSGVEDNTYLSEASKNTSNGTSTVTNNLSDQRTATNKDTTDDTTTVNNSGNSSNITSMSGGTTNTVESSSIFTNNLTQSKASVFNTTDEYVEHIKGLSGKYAPAELVKMFRESLINIDMLVINDLSCLFMQIY